MGILLILFIIFCFTVALLAIKYRNTTVGFFIRFGWFTVCMGIFFFFFSPNFTLLQNGVMAFIAVVGLIYFGYNLKKMMEN